MKKHPLLAFASALLVIAGLAMGGYAALQIKGMNVSSGSQVLPELTSFSTSTNPLVAYSEVKIEVGDFLGTLLIPVLKAEMPIYEGTEDSELKKGVGHFSGSVLPGIRDNSVLAGHRDSVFSQLGKLKKGDLLVVNTRAGKFTYKIFGFRIVMADDRTVIVPTSTAVLTLSTCYPFRYFGNAPKRYIVSAQLISNPSSF